MEQMEPRQQPERESDLLRLLEEELRERLPRPWSYSLTRDPRYGRRRPDGLLRLEAPDGTSAELLVEAKLIMNARDVPEIIRRLEEAGGEAGPTGLSRPLVVGRYLSPRTRDLLRESGASFLDATGNLSLRIDRPAILFEAAGAGADPWRGPERETRTLRGRPAAKVVRSLVDFRPPTGIRELSARSGASLGSTARTVDFLDREALITREGRGPIEDVDWPNLLARWSEDYDFQRSDRVLRTLEPRGLENLLSRLAEYEGPYAVTGSLSARRASEVAESRLASIYAPDPDLLAEVLGLRESDGAANVLISRPFDEVVLERGTYARDVYYAALSQTAVDLLGGPGREPAEGQELISWMAANEGDWRG
jgi:hypothetical protein